MEASSSHCQPPSVKLEIDFDLEFGPSLSEKYQKYEQQQDDHIAVPLSTPVDLQTPPLSGVLHLVESMGSMQTAILQFRQ